MRKRFLVQALAFVLAIFGLVTLSGCDLFANDSAEASEGVDATKDKENAELEAAAPKTINAANIITDAPWYGVCDLVDAADMVSASDDDTNQESSDFVRPSGETQGQDGEATPETGEDTTSPGAEEGTGSQTNDPSSSVPEGSQEPEASQEPSQEAQASPETENPDTGDNSGSLVGTPVGELPPDANLVYESFVGPRAPMSLVAKPGEQESTEATEDTSAPQDVNAETDASSEAADAASATDAADAAETTDVVEADETVSSDSELNPSVDDAASTDAEKDTDDESPLAGVGSDSGKKDSIFDPMGVDLTEFEDVYKISFSLEVVGIVDTDAQGTFTVVRGTSSPVSYVVNLSLDVDTMEITMTCDSEADLNSTLWVKDGKTPILTIPASFVYGDLAAESGVVLPDSETVDISLSGEVVDAEGLATVINITSGEISFVKASTTAASDVQKSMTASADSVEGFSLVYDSENSKWLWVPDDQIADTGSEEAEG